MSVALLVSNVAVVNLPVGAVPNESSEGDSANGPKAVKRGTISPAPANGSKAKLLPNLADWIEEQHNFFKAKHPGVRTWSIKDGVLICDGSFGNCGFLRYREKLTDFTLRLEYRMSKGCNSGVCIRTAVPYDGNPEATLPSQTGFEIQIMDDAGQAATKTSSGAFYGLVAPRVSAARPADEWNTLEISARGPKIRVILNREVVQDVDQTKMRLDKKRPLTGYLSLQNHGHRIEFRNLRIEKLTDS